jgi:hypothetical protein
MMIDGDALPRGGGDGGVGGGLDAKQGRPAE